MRKAKMVISENADFDLKEIADWYNARNKKLIWIFLKDFKEKVKFISENPLACEVRYENFRIIYLKKFPFGIHFKYDENKNLIEIYSVFHTSRDPEIWKGGK
ncbi:plasmid stabilization system protein ParE [Chryseobacterium sp. SLBN-27]|uniref:type II toxin-antitoxin system RelE/ParE family toxin n=1 Tax=Chryseobacterium sp. SLBN-27 TaxID=3042287 RepID=UPI0028609C13|nr:type II toxin-antitoxin system RelE/ParE family toxin [Chryseobacterium sp. SLBN-27]MDR6160216.1 plasmid stabilization system protein ParE [Chryseobacterium sp. SLBN-27]